MTLKEYVASLKRGEAAQIAATLGISPSYFSQLVSGKSTISPARCVEIEMALEKKVTRKDMRDDWQSIWPELAVSQPVSAASLITPMGTPCPSN